MPCWFLRLCQTCVLMLVVNAVAAADLPTFTDTEWVASWRQSEVTTQGPARSAIDLDGFWAFAPAADGEDAPPADPASYGVMLVPGSWAPPDLWSWRAPTNWHRHQGNPFIFRPGSGPLWTDYDPFEVRRAWYARQVEVPADWQGRRVLLAIDRVSTDALVVINGQRIDTPLTWLGGRVDVTAHVRFGASNLVQIVVAVSDESRRELLLMGTGAGTEVEVKIKSRGIVGSTQLLSEPMQPVLSAGLRIEPQVRERRLDLSVPVSDVAAGQRAALEVVIRSAADGLEALKHRQTVELPVEGTPLPVTLPWAEARLWTPADPYLYVAEVRLTLPDGTSDSTTRRFGFRQFDINGRNFMLNGQIFRLRPMMSHMVSMAGLQCESGLPITRELIRNHFRAIRALGFNFQEYWPGDPLSRGSAMTVGMWAEVADEEGMLLSGPMPHLRNHLDAWRADRPEGWSWPEWAVNRGALRLDNDGSGRRIWLRAHSHTAVVTIDQRVALPPGTKQIDLHARMRATYTEARAESWNGARVEMAWIDANDKPLKGKNAVLHLADDAEWVEQQLTAAVPAGAVEVRVALGIWRAIGEAEFADVRLIADGEPVVALNGTFTEADPGPVRERLLDEARQLVDPLAHHPSIVMWGTSGNLFGSSLSPWAIGNRRVGLDNHPSWARPRLRSGLAAMDALATVDSSRPLFTHSGGGVGQVYTANFYHAWTAVQDKTEWLTQHLATGDVPFWIVEYGNPINLSWRRDRAGHTRADTSEPWYTEYAAMELGPEAYTLEGAAYRAALAETYRGTVNDRAHRWRFREPHFEEEPAFQRVSQHHYREVWRHWRALGAAALPIPWQYGHAFASPLFAPGVDVAAQVPRAPAVRDWDLATIDLYGADLSVRQMPVADTLRKVAAPVIAFIAGANVLPAPGQLSGREVLTSRTANYRADTAVQRTVVVINDSLRTVSYDLVVELDADGRSTFRTPVRGELTPGAILHEAITFQAPSVVPGAMLSGRLRLHGHLDGQAIDEHVDLRFFGAIAGDNGQLVVHDPQQTTTPLLRELGYQVDSWQEGRDTSHLIIGRQALASDPQLLSRLEASLRSGTTVLMLEQDPEVLRDLMGLRVARRIARQVWPVASNTELLGDLAPAALTNWAGESTVVDPYPRWYDNQSPEVRTNGWRWGGRGGVSSAAVEKPHFSAWRPILQTEFDLAYAPLLELPVGKGRLVLSTLDLHDHARQDPAAEVLLHRLLDHVRQPITSFTAERSARAVVDARWQERLAAAGIETDEGLDAVPVTAALLIGRELAAGELTTVEAHLAAGGLVVVLPDTPIPADWGVQREAIDVLPGGLTSPRLPALRGLDVSDLRIRAATPGHILVGAGDIDAGGQYAEIARGSGRIAVIGFNPWQFTDEAKPYLRFSAWRQARAFSQVLANHGLRSTHDQRVFAAPDASERLPLSGTWQAYPTALVPGGKDPIADPGLSTAAQAIIAGKPSTVRAQEVELPRPWEELGTTWNTMDGEAVFERRITIPEEWVGRALMLSLGVLDDYDQVFVNGVAVGSTGSKTPRWWTVSRRYEIPASVVSQRELRITVRIWDNFGGGGVMSRDPAALFLLPVDRWEADQTPASAANPYHPDYIDDYATGDDPYRYYNW